MTQLIDAHCHIELYSDPLKLARELEKKQVYTVAVSNLPSLFKKGYPFLRDLVYVKPALGLHPLLAEKHSSEMKDFISQLKVAKFIGEVGLDYSREGYKTKDIQLRSLNAILESLHGEKKIVSFHSLGAIDDLLDLIQKFECKKSILHWYTGSVKGMNRAIELGCYFSVNPAMLRSTKGRDIIKKIPLERLLTESDGPFTKVGTRICTPFDVMYVLDFLKLLYPEINVGNQVASNFASLYRS